MAAIHSNATSELNYPESTNVTGDAMIIRTLRFIGLLLVVAVVLYLLICCLLWVFQRSLIYLPQPRAVGGASTVVELARPDAKIMVSVRPHTGPNAMIYLGGNAEDVSLNLLPFSQAFPEQALYLMHYRGFGGSTGSPSEALITADAEALFDTVYKEHSHVTVVGRSLGTGVAIHLVSERPAARLVLITPYNSLLQIGIARMPLFPVKWMLRDTYESWRYAPLINVPTLFIAAQNDKIIPRASTEELLSHFKSGIATMKIIPDSGHNTLSDSPLYLKMLGDGL
jgi:pimeloyl-ACP methyl ester carboxylesterase